ncbi:Transposase (plasmid) [Mesorhizobium loti]|nr:Transposase [Mesorhizobium loti]
MDKLKDQRGLCGRPPGADPAVLLAAYLRATDGSERIATMILRSRADRMLAPQTGHPWGAAY